MAKDKDTKDATAPAEVTPDPALEGATAEAGVEDPSTDAGEAGSAPEGADLGDEGVQDLTGEQGSVVTGGTPDADFIDPESGEVTNVRAGSTLEDPNQDGVAAGSSEFAGSDAEAEEVDLSGVTKADLQAQAAAADIPADGTKQEIADRLTEAGIDIVKPKGPNGCLTDPECIRPNHQAAPLAHAYGQQAEARTIPL